LPFVRGIPGGLVDSFGIQGFPWGAQYGDPANLNPRSYLPVQLAIEAAKAAGARQLWFNTGTFHSFTADARHPQTLTPAQRRAILETVLAQAKEAQAAGLEVAVHLFNEDKSKTDEKIDWSYWSAGDTKDSPDTQVFKDFVTGVRAAHIGLWLFDDSH
jgi:hypothetical protein